MTLEVNEQPYRVIGETVKQSLLNQNLEFLHVKPGKGAAFVRSKLKNCMNGSILDKTFRAGEMLTTAEIQRKDSQYTYEDGNNCVFMDMETYEETRMQKVEPSPFETSQRILQG